MKLIDKDVVLAIIENKLSYYKDLEDREIISDCGIAAYRVVKMLKSDIESLEVKDVNLDTDFGVCWGEYCNSGGNINDYEVAKHFFELGMATSNKVNKEYVLIQKAKEAFCKATCQGNPPRDTCTSLGTCKQHDNFVKFINEEDV